MDFKRQKFLVFGISRSGYSACEYLLKKGANCYIYDETASEKVNTSIKILEEQGAIKVESDTINEILDLIDVLVISPGVPINHELCVKAKQKNKRILGEFELGVIGEMPLNIAVTGTNGKTTTVYLLESILNEGNIKNSLVGNMGKPITSESEKIKNSEVVVSEISSYQLETINSFNPHIACILNVTPDHLQRHYTLENYVFLKKKIFRNQRESEYTLLNFDDKMVKEFAKDTRGNVQYVSIYNQVEGAYIKEDKVYYKNEYVMDKSDFSLKGEHNLYNQLFAICCSKIIGVDNQTIRSALKNFRGVKHRIQLVLEKGGVRYYNDSKATNTASTISALKTIEQEKVLIIGGYDKGEDYKSLFHTIKDSKVKYLVITGSSRDKMVKQAIECGVNNYAVIQDFALAIKHGAQVCCSGDALLFSPATASFDNFTDFEQRGDAFIKEVLSLNEN